LHYSAKTLETHLQHPARVSDAEPDEAGRSAQRAHLAAKIAGGKQSQERKLARFRAHVGRERQQDFHAPVDYDENPARLCPNVEQNFARRRRARLAVSLQARDLRARELRKHLRAPFLDKLGNDDPFRGGHAHSSSSIAISST
jgi:hypothetical protein